METTYGTSLDALRSYVIGNGEPVQRAPAGMVRLEITHSVLTQNPIGSNNFKNFALSTTISELKDKLYLFVGTSPVYMKVSLMDRSGAVFATLDNDQAQLGSYSPQDGMRIHVLDVDPNSTIAALQDTSAVPKYTISEDDYNKREGTYRKFKATQTASESSSSSSPPPAHVEEEPTGVKVGDRCEVDSEDGSLARRGTVMYVGTVEFSAGYWVGVKFDEPLGKNNGTVKGKQYFVCPPNYGGFVKPNKVRVGDYPEENFDEEI